MERGIKTQASSTDENVVMERAKTTHQQIFQAVEGCTDLFVP
jgi:hypothetical protein